MENIVCKTSKSLKDITFEGLLRPFLLKPPFNKHPIYGFQNWYSDEFGFEARFAKFFASLSENIYVSYYPKINEKNIEVSILDNSDNYINFKPDFYFDENIYFTESGFIMFHIGDDAIVMNDYGENAHLIFGEPLLKIFEESISFVHPPENAEKSGYMPYLEELRSTWR